MAVALVSARLPVITLWPAGLVAMVLGLRVIGLLLTRAGALDVAPPTEVEAAPCGQGQTAPRRVGGLL